MVVIACISRDATPAVTLRGSGEEGFIRAEAYFKIRVRKTSVIYPRFEECIVVVVFKVSFDVRRYIPLCMLKLAQQIPPSIIGIVHKEAVTNTEADGFDGDASSPVEPVCEALRCLPGFHAGHAHQLCSRCLCVCLDRLLLTLQRENERFTIIFPELTI